MKYEIDNLDRKILEMLSKDARTPFLDIARELGVSGGTIHGRYAKMKSAGVIRGVTLDVDPAKIGVGVSCFIGLTLTHARRLPEVVEHLSALPEVTEAHYTTGAYALLVKISLADMSKLYTFLAEKLQASEHIQSTETFVILNSALKRHPPLGGEESSP